MIPTYITVKGNSVRCPNKNLKLLPYILEQYCELLNITVITDSVDIIEICKKYNVKYFLEDKENQKCEFTSIYNFLIKTKQLETVDEFIHLPVTQPIRNKETILNIVNCDISKYDFATTYSLVPNRKIFLLNDDNTFQYDSYERKGCLCNQTKMIDGSVYKIKTNFLIKIIQSENQNNYFWNKSKIHFIENTINIFLDIDEPKDLKLFELYKKIEE